MAEPIRLNLTHEQAELGAGFHESTPHIGNMEELPIALGAGRATVAHSAG